MTGGPTAHEDRVALIALEEGWAAAMIAGDGPAIRAAMSPDFTLTTAGWIDAPVDGESWLRHVSERYALTDAAFDEFAVRIHGDVAIVQCRSRQRGIEVGSGAPWGMVMRYTDVWLRSGSTWMIDVRHASGRRSDDGEAAPARVGS